MFRLFCLRAAVAVGTIGPDTSLAQPALNFKRSAEETTNSCASPHDEFVLRSGPPEVRGVGTVGGNQTAHETEREGVRSAKDQIVWLSRRLHLSTFGRRPSATPSGEQGPDPVYEPWFWVKLIAGIISICAIIFALLAAPSRGVQLDLFGSTSRKQYFSFLVLLGLFVCSLPVTAAEPVASPTIVGSLSGGSAWMRAPRGVTVVGSYAYVVNFASDCLNVVDISDPASPSILGSYCSSNQMSRGYAVTVVGSYAYVARLSFGGGFTVVDISDPFNPSFVASIKPGTHSFDRTHDVAVVGSYAYVTAAVSDSLVAIDISDPASPSVVGRVTNSSYLDGAYGIAVVGSYAYVAAEGNDYGVDSGFTVVDISDPFNPFIVGGVHTRYAFSPIMNRPRGVTVAGSYAYVVGYRSDSLDVVDISDPFNPFIVGGVADSSVMDQPHYVAVAGSYAYVTAFGSNSLVAVDISDPASPSIVGSVADSSVMNQAIGVAVAGSYAYVCGFGSNSLAVVHVPSTPGVGGDPITTFQGHEMRYYLSTRHLTPVLDQGPVVLSQRAGPANPLPGLEAHKGAWVLATEVKIAGFADAILIETVDPTTLLAHPNATALPVPSGARLTTMRLSVGGKQLTTGEHTLSMLTTTVTASRVTGPGLQELKIGNGFVERIDIQALGLHLRITSAKARKLADEEHQVLGLHLDLEFLSFDESAVRGALPEMWGLQPMTETTKLLLDQKNVDN